MHSRPSPVFWLFAALAILVAGLHLAFPGPVTWWNWGFSFFGLLPAHVPWLLAVLLIACGVLIVWLPRGGDHPRPQGEAESRPSRAWIPAGTAFIVSGLIFQVFRTRTHFLGDAALRIRNLADHKHGLSYSVLDQHVLHRIFDPLEARWGLHPETFLSAVSILSGMLSTSLLAFWVWRTERDATARWFLFLLAGASAYVLVFFGYAEQYAPQWVAVLVYLMVARRVIHGRSHVFWAVLSFSIAVAVHLSSLVLALSVLYLLQQYTRGSAEASRPARRSLRVALAVVLGGAAVAVCAHLLRGHGVVEGGQSLWVPLTSAGGNPLRRTYTLFSGLHWVNVLNQHLLLSPVGVLILVALLPNHLRRRAMGDRWVRFLSLGAVPWLLLSCVWGSDLGAPRDWDIFACAALLYTLLAGTLALGALGGVSGRYRRGAVALLVGANLFHTIPWVWVNAGEGSSLARFTRLVETQEGWGNYGHAYAIHELGGYYLKQNRPGEAAVEFQRAARIDPNASYDFEAGTAFLEAGDTENAVRSLAEAVKKSPNLVNAYIYLGMAYLRVGMPEAALGFFETALRLKPDLEDIREVVGVLRSGGTVDFEFQPRDTD